MHVANHSQLSVMKITQRGTERKDPTYRQSVLILDSLQDLSVIGYHYTSIYITNTFTNQHLREHLRQKVLSIDWQDQKLRWISVLGKVSKFNLFLLKFIIKYIEDNSCSICMAEYELDSDLVTLPCLHIFHYECTKPWLIRKNECPLCRTRVD